MKITLTGATGFIGGRLAKRLKEDGHELTILSRNSRPGSQPLYVAWNSASEDPPVSAFESCDAVINLAGEPVAQRWSAAAKERIRASRIDGTHRLVRTLKTLAQKPATLISASAIGIYGSRGNEMLTESSAPGKGFLEDVCAGWEREAEAASGLGIRVVLIRIGIVLGKGGGALATMLPPFRAGVAGRLGSGKQWMSWIHVDDLVRLIVFTLNTGSLRGAVNGVAPEPVTNTDFTRTLAQSLRRPAVIPVPGFGLKLLFGEMANVMLASQRVVPEVALRAGFEFCYPMLPDALAEIIG